MMNLLIAVLLSLGFITTPEEATTEVVKNHEIQVQEIIGDDLLDF